MKFTSLATRLGVFCLISVSVCLTEVLAADQINQVDTEETSKTPRAPFALNPRFVNRSKQPNFTPPGGVRNPVKLSAPPNPTNTSFVNKSKPTSVSSTSSAMLPANEQVILQSRDIGSFGPRWQSFSDYLSVGKGCDQIPLFLIFTNGPINKFQGLRIALAGKSIATLKDFGEQPILTRNLTGALPVGDNLLSVQAIGPAGAKLSWKLVTAKIVVTKVNPTSFALSDKVIIEGRNFSDHPDVTQVVIGDKQATVVSAKSKTIQIKPPSGLMGGKTKLYVMIGNQKSNPIEVTIKGAPEIGSVSMISTAPGQPLTITGTGFSDVAGENEVTIGGYPAEIRSVSSTSITVEVPLGLDAINPSWGVPITVKTNNMEATDPTNSAKINIQLRVF